MSELKPCPFCGSKIIIDEITHSREYTEVKCRCSGCWMAYSYTQRFVYSQTDRVAVNEPFTEVWNRRAKDDQ